MSGRLQRRTAAPLQDACAPIDTRDLLLRHRRRVASRLLTRQAPNDGALLLGLRLRALRQPVTAWRLGDLPGLREPGQRRADRSTSEPGGLGDSSSRHRLTAAKRSKHRGPGRARASTRLPLGTHLALTDRLCLPLLRRVASARWRRGAGGRPISAAWRCRALDTGRAHLSPRRAAWLTGIPRGGAGAQSSQCLAELVGLGQESVQALLNVVSDVIDQT